MFSTSRWLVGSSSMRRFARASVMSASATRARSPPLSVPISRKHFVAAEAERAEMVLHLAAVPERPLLLDRVEHRLAERKVGEVLPEPRRRDRAADPRLAARRRAIAEDGGDERRLARAVGPDERDEVVPSQHRGEVLDEHAARHFDAEVLDRDHLVAAALSRLEVERHRRRIARRRRETRQSLEPLALALRLKRVDARDVPPDVLLFLLHVRALLLQLALAREPSLGALRHELAVVALVRLARARFDVQDVRADGVHERAIVRHDDHRLVGVR